MQPQEWKTWGKGHLVKGNAEGGYTFVKCNHFATGNSAKRALAKFPCGRGSKPGKRSPEGHKIWNQAIVQAWEDDKIPDDGQHDIV
eukprot:3840061-Heterocapsa_arctica.AAC.1